MSILTHHQHLCPPNKISYVPTQPIKQSRPPKTRSAPKPIPEKAARPQSAFRHCASGIFLKAILRSHWRAQATQKLEPRRCASRQLYLFTARFAPQIAQRIAEHRQKRQHANHEPEPAILIANKSEQHRGREQHDPSGPILAVDRQHRKDGSQKQIN